MVQIVRNFIVSPNTKGGLHRSRGPLNMLLLLEQLVDQSEERNELDDALQTHGGVSSSVGAKVTPSVALMALSARASGTSAYLRSSSLSRMVA